MENRLTKISKFMSLILRHKPDSVGVTMNAEGWVSTEELINKINSNGHQADRYTIEQIVATNDKQRFAFNQDKSMIRANQGHSLDVDLKLKETIPPDLLYHGTTIKSLESILLSGIEKRNRQFVHLSATIETAKAVGSRHGQPVILIIQAKAMHDAGFKFYLSENKVWLTEAVPVEFISQ